MQLKVLNKHRIELEWKFLKKKKKEKERHTEIWILYAKNKSMKRKKTP